MCYALITRLSGDEFLVLARDGDTELLTKLARNASEEIRNRFGVTITFGIGSGILVGDARMSATLALFECRTRQ